jgi:endonuclease YncB( thermonuclease family)
MDKIAKLFNSLTNNTNTNQVMDNLKNIKSSDIPEFSLNGIKTSGKIVEIYDGDTCKIVLLNNNVLQKFNCRINGIDTPEMKPPLNKPNREIEIKNAYRCRNRLIQLSTNIIPNIDIDFNSKKVSLDTNTKLVHVECLEFDKYGRLLVNIYEKETPKCLSYNDILVNEEFAKKYNGGTKDEFTY